MLQAWLHLVAFWWRQFASREMHLTAARVNSLTAKVAKIAAPFRHCLSHCRTLRWTSVEASASRVRRRRHPCYKVAFAELASGVSPLR
jgi:hypothetical protein